MADAWRLCPNVHLTDNCLSNEHFFNVSGPNVYLTDNCLSSEHLTTVSECAFVRQLSVKCTFLALGPAPATCLSNEYLILEIVIGSRFKLVREAAFYTQALHSHFHGRLCCARHGGTN